MKWTQTAKQFGINWTIETIVNESLITRGRNTLVSKFLINDSVLKYPLYAFCWDYCLHN